MYFAYHPGIVPNIYVTDSSFIYSIAPQWSQTSLHAVITSLQNNHSDAMTNMFIGFVGSISRMSNNYVCRNSRPMRVYSCGIIVSTVRNTIALSNHERYDVISLSMLLWTMNDFMAFSRTWAYYSVFNFLYGSKMWHQVNISNFDLFTMEWWRLSTCLARPCYLFIIKNTATLIVINHISVMPSSDNKHLLQTQFSYANWLSNILLIAHPLSSWCLPNNELKHSNPVRSPWNLQIMQCVWSLNL